ncbi:hypothetical protein MKX03_008559 [Papaver bracteatum]|nr:hypothetical protein MKX03_008559 [Papaver bracteatum]
MAEVSSNICRSSLVLVLLVSILISTANTKALVDPLCKVLVKKGPSILPEKNCCALVKEVDINCICTMHKALYVASTCGRKIPRIKKCVSIRIGSG